ncbi:hypothetical protein D3C76_591680 [compost metagenome]
MVEDYVRQSAPVGAGLPAMGPERSIHPSRPPSLASQLLQFFAQGVGRLAVRL